jgi:hypothetical protein
MFTFGRKGTWNGRLRMVVWNVMDDTMGAAVAGGGGGQGEETGQQGGQAGKSDDATAKEQQAEKTFSVTINGQTRSLTESELIALASKAGGAEEKFSRAAEMRKEAERGVKLMEVMEAVKGGTATKEQVDTVLEMFGVDPNNVDGYDKMFNPQAQQQPKMVKQQQGTGTIGMEQLDPKIQGALKAAEEQEISRVRIEIEGKTRSTLENDGVLGKMLGGMGSEKKKVIMDELFDMAMQDVREGICIRNQVFGPEMLNDAVQRLRHRVEKFGIPTAGVNHPSAATGVGQMQYGFQGHSGWNIPDKDVKRVTSTDAEWERNVVTRTLQAQQKSMMSGG